MCKDFALFTFFTNKLIRSLNRGRWFHGMGLERKQRGQRLVLVFTSHCQRRYQQRKACGFTIVGRTELTDVEGEGFESESQEVYRNGKACCQHFVWIHTTTFWVCCLLRAMSKKDSIVSVQCGSTRTCWRTSVSDRIQSVNRNPLLREMRSAVLLYWCHHGEVAAGEAWHRRIVSAISSQTAWKQLYETCCA